MKQAAINIPENLRLAISSFNVDRVSAEVVAALEVASVETILLKGPAIATWLYSRDRPRFYTDTDLLVRKRDWKGAMRVLEEIGFKDDLEPLSHPRMEAGDGYPWGRVTDRADVDLHYTLFGIGADPDDLWEVFSEGAVRESVGGRCIAMPSHAARLLHIALHAVQHGGVTQLKPMLDLKQALAKASKEAWLEAKALAQRLDAEETFAAGLQLTPEGRELSAEIGADRGNSVGGTLRLQHVPMAEGIQAFVEAGGFHEKSSLLVRELFPNSSFMRWWTPLARRGRIGLSLAYVWRLIWLSARSVPAYRAWHRASNPRHPSTPPLPERNGVGDARSLEDRLEREREFHDALAGELDPTELPRLQLDGLELAALEAAGDLSGKRVVDLGCGSGDLTLALLAAGARTTAVDLSPGMVGIAKRRVEIFATNGQAEFIVAPAEELPIEDASVDVIVGRFILHHLDIPRAAKECARILAPGGAALFAENSGRNRILMLFRDHVAGRFGIPRYGTPDEKPLSSENLATIREHFPGLQLDYPIFEFFSLFDRQVLRQRWGWSTGALRALDRAIWRHLPFARRWSFRVLVGARH